MARNREYVALADVCTDKTFERIARNIQYAFVIKNQYGDSVFNSVAYGKHNSSLHVVFIHIYYTIHSGFVKSDTALKIRCVIFLGRASPLEIAFKSKLDGVI